MASTVLLGAALPAPGAPADADELPEASLLTDALPDWSRLEEPLVPLVPLLPELPALSEVPVPMVPVLLELPLLPVGLPEASVALPEP
ncbi:MAG: hypothetical protein EOP92_32860 [Lysobacteraceae bacterium]|nr:MAG: hypothetical protein EOP92_32860 [Xanthomonadaceae bacterium]